MARMIDADLLKQHYAWWGAQDINSELKEYKEMFDQIVDAQPTTARVGQWLAIHHGEAGYSAGDFRCNICGKANPCYHVTEYCANCGAKMERRRKNVRAE